MKEARAAGEVGSPSHVVSRIDASAPTQLARRRGLATMPARDGPIQGAVTLFAYRGIPIRAHWSLALGLPFFAWVMATRYFGTTAEGWAWGFAVAVGLFASVTIHELAHSLVALRLGTAIREIILLPIGGASVMVSPPRDPRSEFLIAVVGPLASLGIGVSLVGSALAFGIPLANPASVPPAYGFVLATGYLNLSLGLFNMLLPAFPMDGGRILRAALAQRMGIDRATGIAASMGRALAVLMGLLGIIGGSILLVLIGIFVWAGASAEERSVRITSTLEGVHLSDVMTREPAVVDPSATLDQALGIMLETKHVALPIVDAGRPIGVLRSEDIARVPPPERRITRVGELPPHDLLKRPGDEPAAAVLSTVLEAGLIAVVDASDRLLGIVTATDIMRTVELLGAVRVERPAG